MPFEKGVSGNPHGRPPGGLSLAARIRTLGGEDGATYAQLLHSVAMNEDESTKIRLDAVRILLDRGYGKSASRTAHRDILRADARDRVTRSPPSGGSSA